MFGLNKTKRLNSRLKLLLIIFIVVSNFKIIIAQNKNTSEEIASFVKEIQRYYSPDDELINGSVYLLPDSKIKGNPYLYDEWEKADIFIHNKLYSGILMKYDLVSDNVILKVDVENGLKRLVSINRFQVDSFKVGNSFFINSRIIFSDSSDFAYYEKINNGKIMLLKRYDKVLLKKYSDITPYGNYSNVRVNTYLFDHNHLYNVNTKHMFLKYFKKENRTKIKSFIKEHKIKYKNASQQKLKELMDYCSLLIIGN